ncbi:MAG: type III secretion system export apparatus subunit SctV [Deltaproteobacteria bacterium]|jgi:type III secretion protein V|nr:type III secretion system export apparatus subunit SctV [Deltaproteobacteria bacterium]
MNRLKSFPQANVLLALIVVLILVLMIIPLPTLLVDLLLTVNISLSATLLIISLYVTEPLKIATFPSLLLLASMFRLGLNVATTRLILLQADAGRVIESFGNFVVSGNIIVGAVVFLILALIQFIVIAKGSERVAEVAARFTLDAMPGKQMAIDAELRSGHITHKEARKIRRSLQRESQLYGAMDGAMKFVKGDAIAGLIITVINIIGGLAVGMMQMEMSAAEAVSTYSVLTIGDGLVSQIPSLLVSLASGFIITRVASEDKNTELGEDISSQILAHPAAVKWVGALLILMALVPGLPFLPFMILGLTFAFVGYKIEKSTSKEEKGELMPGDRLLSNQSEHQPSNQEKNTGELPLPLVRPLVVEISTELSVLLYNTDEDRQYLQEELIGEIRSRNYWQRGLIIPPVSVKINPALADFSYQILLNETNRGQGKIIPDYQACRLSPLQLKEHNLDMRQVEISLPSSYYWLDNEELEKVMDDKTVFYDSVSLLSFHLDQILSKYGYELLNMDSVSVLIGALKKTQPALVEECYPDPVELGLLTDICSRLVEENICIRYMDKILYSLKKWADKENDPVILTEYVRMDLKKEISARYCSSGILPVFLASHDTEEEIRAGIQKGDKGSFLSLDPEVTLEIQKNAGNVFAQMASEVTQQVIVASMDIRRYLRQILAVEIPQIVVLSYQELDSDIQIQPIGEI